MPKEWFAIRTKPQKEIVAKAQYARQGYTVYLPLALKTIRHARRVEKLPRPFLPGYLFLHLAPEERNWMTIGSTIGSVGAVHFGEVYPVLPDQIIKKLQSREDAHGYISLFDEKILRLEKGVKVQITSGELAGLDGLFLEMRGEDRVLILLNLLRQQVSAAVPVSVLSWPDRN